MSRAVGSRLLTRPPGAGRMRSCTDRSSWRRFSLGSGATRWRRGCAFGGPWRVVRCPWKRCGRFPRVRGGFGVSRALAARGGRCGGVPSGTAGPESPAKGCRLGTWERLPVPEGFGVRPQAVPRVRRPGDGGGTRVGDAGMRRASAAPRAPALTLFYTELLPLSIGNLLQLRGSNGDGRRGCETG